MQIKDVSTHYLLMEFYLQSFTYMCWDPFMKLDSSKQMNLRKIIKNELKRRDNEYNKQ